MSVYDEKIKKFIKKYKLKLSEDALKEIVKIVAEAHDDGREEGVKWAEEVADYTEDN